MVAVAVTGKYQNGLVSLKWWKFTLIIVKKIIAVLGFYKKAAVVDVGYFHVIVLS